MAKTSCVAVQGPNPTLHRAPQYIVVLVCIFFHFPVNPTLLSHVLMHQTHALPTSWPAAAEASIHACMHWSLSACEPSAETPSSQLNRIVNMQLFQRSRNCTERSLNVTLPTPKTAYKMPLPESIPTAVRRTPEPPPQSPNL